MKQEIISGNFLKEAYSWRSALDYVKARQNPFSKATRRYVERYTPAIIRETSRGPNGEKHVWLWCFDEDALTIYQFVGTPKKKDIQQIFSNIGA